MLLIDSYTLAKHFVNGDLTKKQFMSLNASLAEIEKLKTCHSFIKKCIGFLKCSGGILRYSIKCHIKTLLRIIKYSIFGCIALLLFTIYRVDFDDLEYMADSGFQVGEFVMLLAEGSPEKIPGDIRQVAEYMSTAPQWKWQHIRQFESMWENVADNKKPAMRKTHWFRTFQLVALIKEVESKKMARNSLDNSIKNVKEIRSLVKVLV